jgi:hypothetical protein
MEYSTFIRIHEEKAYTNDALRLLFLMEDALRLFNSISINNF